MASFLLLLQSSEAPTNNCAAYGWAQHETSTMDALGATLILTSEGAGLSYADACQDKAFLD